MSLSGTTSNTPDPQADLQEHIPIVVNAIGKIIFDEFNYHASPGLLKLTKDLLNTLSLNYVIDTKRNDRIIKDIHVKSLIRHGKIVKSEIDVSRATTDDDITKAYAYEPLSTLVLTLKLFHQYLKVTKSKRSNPTFANCFSSEFHLFAMIASAAIVSNKVVYDEISPYTSDIDTAFGILYSNILRLLDRLFLRVDLNNDAAWACNAQNASKLLKIIRKFEALSEDEQTLFKEVDRLMPEAGKKTFRDLYQQLHILSLFKSSEQHDSDFNLYYSDTDESSDDSENRSRSHSTSSRDISEFEDENSSTNFNLYENQFLKIIAFKTHFCFSLHDACELLSNAKKYVAANQSLYVGFDLLLSAFGEKTPETALLLGITRPTQRQMQCLFDRFKEMSLTPLKATLSHEGKAPRPTLKRASS